jgi:hypothetical protein
VKKIWALKVKKIYKLNFLISQHLDAYFIKLEIGCLITCGVAPHFDIGQA